MPPLLLKISISENAVTKLLHFDKSMTVFDACRHIRAKTGRQNTLNVEKSHGLFLPTEDPSKGVWLENGRTLDSYRFKSAKTLLEYRSKQRPLRVRTLDGATRRVFVDDSLPAFENTRAVCARIGLQNAQEFSFTVDTGSQSTLQRAEKPSADRKLDTLRKEKHTHDLLVWVDPKKTLREQGLFQDSTEVTLRKKYFFTDSDVGANDPVQLHLLYTQTFEAITKGVHPVTAHEAVLLSALRCQEMFGDFAEKKFQKGSIRSTLRGMLPVEYRKDTKKLKESFLQEYKKLCGLTELEAKFHYIERCRKLDTYGTSFFAVKEKVPRRNRLHPVLLGIKRECVITLDVKSKVVLESWELQTIHSYFSTPTSFCLNFGGYRGLYIVKTTEGESLVQLLDGYIELIQQTLKKKTDSSMSATMEQRELTPKERMQQVIVQTVTKLSKSVEQLDRQSETKIKKSKASTIEVAKLHLSALVSAVLYSSATMWEEVALDGCDHSRIAAAAYTLGPVMKSLATCSKLLASLGLTDKDGVRIISSTKALFEAVVRLLELLQQGDNIHGRLQVTLEDISSRSGDLLGLVGMEKGRAYSTYQSAAPALHSANKAVSSFIAQTKKISETGFELSLEPEVASCVQDLQLSSQVLSCMFTLVSSCAESPTGQTLLMDSTQAVIEAVHRLCLTAKAVCLDGAVLTEIGASACTVTSTLHTLTTLIGRSKRQQMVKDFYSVKAEATILRSLLTRGQPTSKVLMCTKTLVLKVVSLMKSLKAHDSSIDFEQNKETLETLRKMQDEIGEVVKGVKESPKNSETILGHLEKAMLIVTGVVAPFLEELQETRLSSVLRTTMDSVLALSVIVKDTIVETISLEDQELRTKHLEQAETLEQYIKGLLTKAAGKESQEMSTTAKDMFPCAARLLALTEVVESNLQPQHEHISLVFRTWSSYVHSSLWELKQLFSKADNSKSLHIHTNYLTQIKATVGDKFIGTEKYSSSLEKANSLRGTLEAALVESEKTSKEMNADMQLYSGLKKIERMCLEIECKLLTLLPCTQSEFIGYQMCKTTDDMGELMKYVTKTVSFATKSESSLRLVEHATTCLESLSDVLQCLAQGETPGDVIEHETVKIRTQSFLCAIEDLVALTLTIRAEGFNTATVEELSRSVGDMIPDFVLEEIDSGFTVHALFIRQCQTLTSTVSQMDIVDVEDLPSQSCMLIASYHEVLRIIHTIQVTSADEQEALSYCVKSLAESLVSMVQASHGLHLHSESAESRQSLKENIHSVHEELSQLVLLSQLSDIGAQFSAVHELKSSVMTVDSLWVCSAYAQQSSTAVEQVDSATVQTKIHSVSKLALQEVQALSEAVESLAEVCEITPARWQEAALHSSYILSPIIDLLKENQDLEVVSALRDISTVLITLLRVPTYCTSVQSTVKIAQERARFLLRCVQEERREPGDVLSSTVTFIDLLLATMTSNQSKQWVDTARSDVIHLNTLLSLLGKQLRENLECASVDKTSVTECAILTRLTLTSLTEVSSSVLCRMETEADKTEFCQMVSGCLQSVKSVCVEIRDKANRAEVKTTQSVLEAISQSSQEILDVYEDLCNGAWSVRTVHHIHYQLGYLSHDLHTAEDTVDSADGVEGEEYGKVMVEGCSTLAQALQHLTTLESLTSDKRLWIQTHIEMALDMKAQSEKTTLNQSYFIRMLLKMMADTLLLWKALDVPVNSDWLVLIAATNALTQALASG